MYGARIVATHPPRYNVAPSTNVLACRLYRGKERELVPLRWGLVPSWSKGLQSGAYSMINAKAETITEKPAYRDAFRRRRCLIPTDGFFEWKGPFSPKQPHFICRRDGNPFSLAGVWDHWEKNGERISSCSIIVTQASHYLAHIHDRMPVIVNPEDYDRWLDPKSESQTLLPLLVPYEADDIMAYSVGSAVNDPKNDTVEILKRV